MEGKTFLMRLAIQPEPILYVIFSKEIGRQFLMYFLDLFPFGMQVIIPSF